MVTLRLLRRSRIPLAPVQLLLCLPLLLRLFTRPPPCFSPPREDKYRGGDECCIVPRSFCSRKHRALSCCPQPLPASVRDSPSCASAAAMVEMREPAPWKPSSATVHFLGGLVETGLLPANVDGERPVWISLGSDSEPHPPKGYVVSLARLHERGFGVPAVRFIMALCFHYQVELHNFSPNAISQAAVFVAVCEGFLGVPAHWDLWRHLFAASSTPRALPRASAAPFAPAASWSRSKIGGRTCTSPVPWL